MSVFWRTAHFYSISKHANNMREMFKRVKTYNTQKQSVLATTVAQCGQNSPVWPTCDQSVNPAVQAQLRQF